MGKNRATRGTSLMGAAQIGEGEVVKGVHAATVAVDPASLAATTKSRTSVTVTGIAVGDMVVAEPPSTLNDDLIFCGVSVTADDTVGIDLYNPTGGAVDQASASWKFRWIDLT